ncbi:MAG: capsular biosynthesis protein [Bacteroidales bacterium]|nr:capsular biosynthesis protein [Bacteroidales bacterium]
MFWFKKKKNIDFHGFNDCHSHILPGVDDGVKKMSDSLVILEAYEKEGIQEVVFTPHIMADVPNTPEDLRQRFEAFKSEYKGPIKLHLAAEYMLDSSFPALLDSGNLLTHGDGNRLLVETSYFQPPLDFDDLLFEIQTKGYEPVLAHPERYVYMSDKHYLSLRDRGITLQMNIGSLAGLYGEMAQKKALKLLLGGFYTMAGSDIHSPRMIPHFLETRLGEKEAAAFAAIKGFSI